MRQALGHRPRSAPLHDRVAAIAAWPPGPAEQADALTALEQGEVVVLAVLSGIVVLGREITRGLEP